MRLTIRALLVLSIGGCLLFLGAWFYTRQKTVELSYVTHDRVEYGAECCCGILYFYREAPASQIAAPGVGHYNEVMYHTWESDYGLPTRRYQPIRWFALTGGARAAAVASYIAVECWFGLALFATVLTWCAVRLWRGRRHDASRGFSVGRHVKID